MRARPPATGRRSRGLAVAAPTVILAALALLLPAPARAEAPYRGRLLIDVLRELQAEGLDLAFSTAVVSRELRVTVEPASSEPRRLLREILAPLDLHAEDGPGGTVLILAGPPPTGRLRGRVTSAGAPVAGATVEVDGSGRATTDDTGGFEIPDVPAGTHDITAEAFGFSPATISRVRVTAERTTSVALELDRHPAFVTVVVTPGSHSLVREEQGSSRTLTSEEIDLAPAIGGDVSRVVELLPGVAAADNTAAFHSRGSVVRDVSWVFDGLELYDPFHFQSFLAPFSLIDANTVDRIDFLGGGFTADRGDRHGGFVEVQTLAPGEGAGGELEVGTLNSRVACWSPISRTPGAWLVSARGWYPEALLDAIEVGRGEDGLEPRFADFYGKAAFLLSPDVQLSAHGLFSYDRLKFQEADEEINESVDALTRNSYAWVRLLTTAPANVSTDTVLSGGRIERRRDGVSSTPGEPLVVEDDRDVNFLGLTNDTIWQIAGAHALKAGFDLRELNSSYRYGNLLPGDPASSISLRLGPDGTYFGAYVAYRARASATVTTEVGLRWDRTTHTEDSEMNPRFNLVWRPRERSELRLAIGRFTQTQRIHELQIEDGETDFQRAEVAEQAELSFVQGFRSGLRFRVDAYYRELSDLRPRYENLFEPVELFPETAEDRIEIAPDGARLRGIELILRGDPGRPFFWWASYTLSSAEDLVDGRYVSRSWDQPHAATFLVGYRRTGRWSVSLSGVAHTGWPTTPVSAGTVMLPGGGTELEVVPGERNSIRFPDYARIDLQARVSFPVPRGNLWLELTVANLTDRANACCVQDFFFVPRPDGSTEVQRQLDHWLGLTPALSVLWSF